MAHRTFSRSLLRILGLGVVLIWLVMIGLLVRKVHFGGKPAEIDSAAVTTEIHGDEREWKEIYLQDRKVGYAVSAIRRSDQGYYIQEELFLKLNLMGLGRSLYTVTQAQVDRAFLLKSFRMMMTSGVVRYALSGRVEGRVLLVTSESAGRPRVQKIPIETTPVLSAGLSHFFKSRRLVTGESYRLPVFDPSTLSQKEMVIRVTGRETLNLNRIDYDAYRLEAELWGKSLTFWVDEAGRTLKEQGFMGFTTVRSSAARAPSGIRAEESEDIYEMAAVRPDRLLRNPERLAFIKLKVEGIEVTNPQLNQGRQNFKEGFLEITKERMPSKGYPLLPFRDLPGDVKGFMAPDLNIESDDSRMIEAARTILKGATDPVSAAKKLLDWVHRHVEKKPVLTMPSALEVLRTREGDCNEHAALLTALLRAAGIPGRLCIGLVYTRDKFYYHAWTEAWLGKWVSLDATLNQMPADATHIKWAEGNLSQQLEIARLLGEIRIQVLDFRHD
jgi:Transglutaminase-like superfamily